MAEQREELALELDLRHYIHVFLRRRWIIFSFFLISVLTAALYVYSARPVFSATALILIEKERGGKGYNEGIMVETSADDYYQTQYELLKSRSLLKKVHEKLELGKLPEFAGGAASLAGSISISPVSRSRLVKITAEYFDPKLAAGIANALAEQFVEDNLESKLYISKDILKTLFPGTLGEGDAAPIPYDSLPAIVNSRLVQNLKGEYATLETRLGELSRRYTPEHPERLRLKSQMESLDSRIAVESRRAMEGMKAELSGRMLGNNVRVVDPAEVPDSPSKPRKTRMLLVSAALGLMGGFLLALGIDMLDQTLHSQEEIEYRLGLSFLGSIPMAAIEGDTIDSYKKLLEGPKSFTGESLKNIRTMVGLAAAGKPMKSILLTSTGQGEGKTFIAISLAAVFAQLGEKVLLIEGDLRRPNLHKRFGLSKEIGLSHYLAHGKDAQDATSVIRPSAQPNLDVIGCGHLPPNPAELLSTPRVQVLLEWAQARYDRILIDGTPIFPVTDALLWARHCDAAIFVVKFGGTNGNLAAKACRKLADGGLKIAGAIVNQVTSKAQGYYGDYYYYYYYYHSDYVNPPELARK